MITNEFEALEFLENIITGILLPNENLIENPEDNFTLFDATNTSTPAVMVELVDTQSTKNAVNGQMLSGETRFVIGIYVGKLNRKKSEYKLEIVSLIGRIQSAFSTNGNRILWHSVEFGDYALEDGNITGALINIGLPVGNYSYEISNI